ncbi:uncharacterized protein V6R79_008388 [Siganus canaliculatus]
MSVVALSPVAPEPLSPMVTSVTPIHDPDPSAAGVLDGACLQRQDGTSSPGPSRGGPHLGPDPALRSQKPPPLHTGADWKVVLHLPEIETWLRATSDRVTQLTHSVAQDGDNRHVDAHLVQLKDVCEDISDHVEQIHALLETEFSLKLLSYSVNIIVDIRTVQLLWHQLRVSVLVLKERLLQGLQDSNGNFTRQTDILQAFSEDQQQTRLDALTEVDDCGQLTIRCSQDYFSLDCGITAFELSDYSPGDEPETRDPEQEQEPPLEEDSNTAPEAPTEDAAPELTNHNRLPPGLPTMQCGMSSQSEGTKRPLQGVSGGQASPTQPSLPKKAALFSEGGAGPEQADLVSGRQVPTQPSHISPSLMDPPDRSRFWLELSSAYPEQETEGHDPSVTPRPPAHVPLLPQGDVALSDSDSSLPSPMREQLMSSDLDASGEESEPRPPPGKTAVWIVRRQAHKRAPPPEAPPLQAPPLRAPEREHWFGSEEFLALPAQLQKSELLALKLESLAQSVPLRPGASRSAHDALQDVDDWDLTELNPDWASGDEAPPPPPTLLPHRRSLSRFSSSSSSIESGPLSDLQSDDDDGRRSAGRRRQPAAPPGDARGGASLVQQLLDDIYREKEDGAVWRQVERLVQQLDGFISWLQDSLDSTDNWTQPKQELDSLRLYLDTHLSFKMNVDSRSALKENIMTEGRALLPVITAHHSGLKDILHLVSSQWDQLQRQIRRQHGWMLRALRCIQARLLYSSQSYEPSSAAGGRPTNGKAPCSGDVLQDQLISGQCEAQRAALEQMAVKLRGLQYPSPTSRRRQPACSSSLQEFEADYQELWDWLMDMDAMVTDSHQLMMSEEQRCQLFKSSHAELVMMEGRKSALLARAESLKRSGIELPEAFHHSVHNLTHTWSQLQSILSDQSGPGSSRQKRLTSCPLLASGAAAVENPRSTLSPLTNSLLEQLETRIKELKTWLRDTELLIFNSCLRQDKDSSEQLSSFKSLCSEVRSRRRGVSSVLKLCQKLLQQNQTVPTVEVGPEAEQHREALQLLSINLERRWEAIVMQALQWQKRLKKELGERQVPGNFLEPGLVDLHQMSPVASGPVAPPADDSWEWDETDMTITEPEPPEAPEPDLTLNLPTDPPSHQAPPPQSQPLPPGGHQVYQVYSLHSVQLYQQPLLPQKQRLLLKSPSKDSSFSSIESLPDLLLGGAERSSGRGERHGGHSANSRRSESESGIVSDTGDVEMSEDDGASKFSVRRRLREEEEEEEEKMEEEGGQRSDSIQTRAEEKRRRPRRGGGEAVEILINGHGILTPADSDSDLEVGGVTAGSSQSFLPCRDITEGDQLTGLETPPPPLASRGSSLESLLALGVDLFPSRELRPRSASLESVLAPCLSADTGGSLASLEGGEAGKGRSSGGDAASSGELSRRTLDLLRRLENIQNPLTANMTRSVSDMTLRSAASQRSALPASPSLGGRRSPLSAISSRRGPPSLINESSATPSLTELSSAEDSSLGSEDFRVRNQRHLSLDPSNGNAGCRKRCRGNGGGAEEVDGASLSLVVNVSSACTDEDEDDSDLLSSSTLTLTEEELGVRDGEDGEGERLSGASSADEDEEDMEGSYDLELEDMKRELQTWIRPPRSSKTEAGLWDELQCGSNVSSSATCCPQNHGGHAPKRAPAKTAGGDTERPTRGEEEEQRRKATRSYISQFVDDVENGNVEQSGPRTKDEDDELLRDESGVFAKDAVDFRTGTGSELNRRPSTSLVGELRGELPCHCSSLPSPPSLSPVDDCSSAHGLQRAPPAAATAAGRRAITIQETFKFSSFVTEEATREVRDKESSLPPRKRLGSSCCRRSPPRHGVHEAAHEAVHEAVHEAAHEAGKDGVHDFVMEIIDMTSLALKSKEQSPGSQIRDKVLEHSHRTLHLRGGDFYSYLSLSSHDSDCGEVTERSTPPPYGRSPSPESAPPTDSAPPSLPLSPDIRDEETLFAACTEEVYLGPPLCYSMAPPRKQNPASRPEAAMLDQLYFQGAGEEAAGGEGKWRGGLSDSCQSHQRDGVGAEPSLG